MLSNNNNNACHIASELNDIKGIVGHHDTNSELKLKFLFVGVSPFGGKSALFRSINSFKLSRYYDKNRFYEGFYKINDVIIIDLDIEAFHIFELVNLDDLKSLLIGLLNTANLLNDVKKVIAVGHIRKGCDYAYVCKNLPINDGRDSKRQFSLRQHVYVQSEFIVSENMEFCENERKVLRDLGFIHNELSKYSKFFR